MQTEWEGKTGGIQWSKFFENTIREGEREGERKVKDTD
jgi:hypothetical protein